MSFATEPKRREEARKRAEEQGYEHIEHEDAPRTRRNEAREEAESHFGGTGSGVKSDEVKKRAEEGGMIDMSVFKKRSR